MSSNLKRVFLSKNWRWWKMDTPGALKASHLPGPAWDLVAAPLLPALEALAAVPGVHQVILWGDSLHAITTQGAHTAESLQAALGAGGFGSTRVEAAEPTLEDVFVALAGHGAAAGGVS
ncbi:MAG: hypothetical protein M5U01_12780 [Ardenticatenaceae bacterium]|nr:hypothetical protein [Ardenticatenaceae bacterium]